MPTHIRPYSNNITTEEKLVKHVVTGMRIRGMQEYHPMQFEKLHFGLDQGPDSDGGCGEIYAWRDRGTKQMVAVKVIKVEVEKQASSEKLNKLRYYFEREYTIWGQVGRCHPNIVPLYGFVDGPILGLVDVDAIRTFPGLVSPFYKNGDLARYLANHRNRVIVPEKFKWLRDVATALEYLHYHKIAHRDIKAANVLLDDDMVARLGDFGSSKIIDATVPNSSTSTELDHWMPPEYIQYMGRTEGPYHNPQPSGDIWSFGCLLIEVIREKKPYETRDPIRYLMHGQHPPEPPAEERFQYFDWLKEHCWQRDPTRRSSATKIKHRITRLCEELDKGFREHFGIIPSRP